MKKCKFLQYTFIIILTAVIAVSFIDFESYAANEGQSTAPINSEAASNNAADIKSNLTEGNEVTTSDTTADKDTVSQLQSLSTSMRDLIKDVKALKDKREYGGYIVVAFIIQVICSFILLIIALCLLYIRKELLKVEERIKKIQKKLNESGEEYRQKSEEQENVAFFNRSHIEYKSNRVPWDDFQREEDNAEDKNVNGYDKSAKTFEDTHREVSSTINLDKNTRASKVTYKRPEDMYNAIMQGKESEEEFYKEYQYFNLVRDNKSANYLGGDVVLIRKDGGSEYFIAIKAPKGIRMFPMISRNFSVSYKKILSEYYNIKSSSGSLMEISKPAVIEESSGRYTVKEKGQITFR